MKKVRIPYGVISLDGEGNILDRAGKPAPASIAGKNFFSSVATPEELRGFDYKDFLDKQLHAHLNLDSGSVHIFRVPCGAVVMYTETGRVKEARRRPRHSHAVSRTIGELDAVRISIRNGKLIITT